MCPHSCFIPASHLEAQLSEVHRRVSRKEASRWASRRTEEQPPQRQTHPPAIPPLWGPPAGCSEAARPRRPGPTAARQLEEPRPESRGSGRGLAEPEGSDRGGSRARGGGRRGEVAAPFLPGGMERWAGAFRGTDRSEVLEAE